MAHHILGGADLERYAVAGGSTAQDVADDLERIEERVTQSEAEKMLDAWKKYKV